MIRTLLISSVILCILGISFAFTPAGEPEEEWSNLKVLPKNISEEKLDSIMDHFKIALGVKCGFCHAMDPDTSKGRHFDFASDAKPEKDVARNMLRMTATINETFFNSEKSDRTDTLRTVMCYTCHRGSKNPEASMLLPQVDSIMQLQRKKH